MPCSAASCATHLPVVALQIEHVLKRGDGVDVDDVCVDCRKHVATVAEGTLKMLAERKC